MLANQFYSVISLKPSAFRNQEILSSENYKSGKFLCLDIKEKENEYHVVFVDDLRDLQVLPVNKVRFDGLVSAEEAMNYFPVLASTKKIFETKTSTPINPMDLLTETLEAVEATIEVSEVKPKGRPKKVQE